MEKEKELERKLEEVSMRLDVLMENMPGGFLIYEAETGHFQYLSPALLELFGCSEESFRERYYNSFELLIYKQDRRAVREMIEYQVKTMKQVEVNFRVKGMLEETRYFEYKGRLVTEADGRRLFYAVLNDVSDRILVEKELQRMNNALYVETERYKLMQEAIEDLPFDYDIAGDRLFITLKGETIETKTVECFIQSGTYKYYISRSDVETGSREMQTAILEPKKGKVELRLRFHTEDQFRWYRVFYASFADQNGKVIRAVGSLKDVHAEHLIQEELKNKVRLDAMTGVLNKDTITTVVKDYLSDFGKNGFHAMLVVDTDNFKSVNDTFGHLFGDHVIKIAAGIIKNTFRESDFVGRIGGDEFLIFMKNTTTQATHDRAAILNREMRKTFEKEGLSVSISCSIGISFYPDQGLYYEDLFRLADSALYEAKHLGKDRYVMYHKSE